MALPQVPSALQKEVIRYIHDYMAEHMRPPAYREIESAVGMSSVSVVSYHLKRLTELGLVQREKQTARGLRLTDAALAILGHVDEAAAALVTMLHFPIQGEIIASAPVEYLGKPDPDDVVLVDAAMLPRRTDNLFALRVRGDSMIDALVTHGDIVLLEREVEVRNGDMVAAFLLKEQENTLKYFYREGNRIRLQPANRAVDPIFTSARNLQIQGRVRLVVRQMGRRLH